MILDLFLIIYFTFDVIIVDVSIVVLKYIAKRLVPIVKKNEKS